MSSNSGEDLWNEYCSFFEKDFSEQLEYNKTKMDKYFKEWQQTKMAKHLCPNGVAKFDDIPLTTYQDYPILHEFGKRMENLQKTVPRRPGESYQHYYDRLNARLAHLMDGWMVGTFYFSAKTTGTSGESKWFTFSHEFYENMSRDVVSGPIIGCSDARGTTRLKRNDKFLNLLAPPPYIAGYILNEVDKVFTLVPSLEVSENIKDMRQKLPTTLKAVEKEGIDFASGVASMFHMVNQYFTNPYAHYMNYYESMDFGITKILLFLKLMQIRLFGTKYNKVRDVIQPKGIGAGGTGTEIYIDMLKDEYGMEPFVGFACTEFGSPFLATPENKANLSPVLRSNYFEFIGDDGEIYKIDELKKENVYEYVGTAFGSTVIRYQIGDLLKVVGFRDDGLPYLAAEGRKDYLLSFFGYFNISEAIAVKAIAHTKLPFGDKWAVEKQVSPNERINFLIEQIPGYSEKQVERALFDALLKISQDFRNYTNDFSIHEPASILNVEFLRRGAFTRYTMQKQKAGVALGQIKPPKMLRASDDEIVNILRAE